MEIDKTIYNPLNDYNQVFFLSNISFGDVKETSQRRRFFPVPKTYVIWTVNIS